MNLAAGKKDNEKVQVDLNKLRKINETMVRLQLFSAKAMPLELLILTQ